MRPLFLVLASLLALPAWAARFEIPVQGSRELTLAIAAPVMPRGDPDQKAALLRDTVEKDLAMTGYFEMVPLDAHIERGMGVEPGSFPFDPWRMLRTAALVKLRVLPAGDTSCDPAGQRMCLDVFIYDVLGQEKLAGKRLRGTPAEVLSIAHQAADEVLLALVGLRGFFGDVLAAVQDRTGNKEIWLVGIDGARAQAVTRNGSINLSPAWSPDHGTLAWTSYRRGNADVYAKDLGTGAVRTVSASPGVDTAASFSPDGSLVAVARSEQGDTDIFLLDARTGRTIRRLTQGGGIDVSPHFSPDGTQIVFASERSGGSQIYVVDVAGGTPRRVTNLRGFFTDPVWSPDGGAIAFVSRDGRFDIMTIRPDGTGVNRLTQDQGDNEDPSWSPDGRYLVFTSTRKGGRRIWLSTANGRHQVALTDDAGWSQPVWSR
ncbi:MAG: PD40 domain-containing protein [Alphaproteobacteria bacterium]|nr:PD40 domain-containing protein [Alphaproteobacteria bacterium]